ncbi:MAG: Hpt domain-containing protein [Candidatus Aminicenantes bacterium]|nr:Hpt domain-containing protein [Candidatus Aminicenantes bacterium]
MNQNELQGNSPIDYPSALARIGNDASFLSELLDLFIMDFEAKYDQLSGAISDEDFSAIQDLGHSIKGASANLSLPFIQEASFAMESAGKDKDIQRAKESFIKLEKEFTNLKSFIASGAGT